MDSKEQIAALKAENRKLRAEVSGLRLVAEMRVGPVRLEAVERRGILTFSMCFDNDVRAHMGEQEALLFTGFVRDTIRRKPSSEGKSDE